MKPELILVGGGGHCRACIDVIQSDATYEIVGIVDLIENLHHSVMGHEVIASDEDLPELAQQYENFLVTIGHIKDARKKIAIYSTLKSLGVTLPFIISPLAYVAPSTKIKAGTIVMHHAIINSGAELGENCIVNTRALVEHDAVIDNHCHISTGAVVNGGVRIGSGTFIGSLTTIRENIHIGTNCIIGAGQAVMQDVEDNTTFKH